MNFKRLALAASLALILATPVPALGWGDAPTHPSILYDLLSGDVSLPDAIATNPQVFVQAAAAPDIAWTPLFRNTGRSYIHTLEFADSLLAVAQDDSELAMAFAWGAHLAADAAGERSDANPGGYIPEAEPLHQWVEVAVDTVVFYTFPPPNGLSSWDQVHISFDTILLFRASVHYSRHVERVPLVWPKMADHALNSLEVVFTAEYDYLELKKDASLSQAFLNDLADKGILPSADFYPYYDQSVEAAAAWILNPELSGLYYSLSGAGASQVMPTPVPASVLLLGSGLLGLGLLGQRRKNS